MRKLLYAFILLSPRPAFAVKTVMEGISSTNNVILIDTTNSRALFSTIISTGPEPWTSVDSFGAKGDGSSDDTAAIQSAVNYTSGTVRFSCGKTYLVTSTITVSNLGEVIQGCGYTHGASPDPITVIKPGGTIKGWRVFYLKGDSEKIQNLAINGVNAPAKVSGILIEGRRDWVIDSSIYNMTLHGVVIGCQVVVNPTCAEVDNGLVNVYADGNTGTGYYISDDTSGYATATSATVTIIGGDTQQNSGLGIYIGSATYVTVIGIDDEANLSTGVYVSLRASNISFYGGDVERNSPNFYIDPQAGINNFIGTASPSTTPLRISQDNQGASFTLGPQANAKVYALDVEHGNGAYVNYGLTVGTFTSNGNAGIAGLLGAQNTAPKYPLDARLSTPGTDTSDQAVGVFVSSDVTNPSGLIIRYQGASTIGNQQITLQTGEIGVSNGGILALQGNAGVTEFGSGINRSTADANGNFILNANSSMTLTGSGGVVTSKSSGTFNAVFGDGSNLTGTTAMNVPAAKIQSGTVSGSLNFGSNGSNNVVKGYFRGTNSSGTTYFYSGSQFDIDGSGSSSNYEIETSTSDIILNPGSGIARIQTTSGTQLYYCSAGASAGNLCRGNGCSCSGGSWTALGIYVP